MELIITFGAYFIIILTIAVFAFRATKSESDYLLGGRSFNGIITAMGVGAADMSGWLMLALPGAVYAFGLHKAWMPISLLLGAYLNWILVAKRLRLYTEIANNSITIPAYFENRFRDPGTGLRTTIALTILLFFTVYCAAGFVAGATTFADSFDISYERALYICAAIIIIYTAVGGFLAVNWVDLFQGGLMLFALLILPTMTVINLGGVSEGLNIIQKANVNYLDMYHTMTALGIFSLMSWGLGYFGQPHILVRFMASRSLRDIDIGRRIYIVWMTLALIGAILIGFFGIALFADFPLENPEVVFLKSARLLFNIWLADILLAAVLSAVISTIAAQLMASASSLAEDLYHVFLRKKASEKELIWVSRAAVVLIAFVAIYLAHNPGTTILELVAYAWAGLGAAFGPVILLSLYWKRMNRQGALSGMVLGALTVLAWNTLEHYYSGIFQLYEIIPGMLVGTLTAVVVSLLTEAPKQDILDEFEEYKRRLKSYK